LPHVLEVIIRSATEISTFSVLIECSGIIGDADWWVLNVGSDYTGIKSWIPPDRPTFYRLAFLGGIEISAQAPVLIKIWSKKLVHLKHVKRLRYQDA
jgi:hypothetical protein